MLARRLLIALAVLMAVTALAASLAPEESPLQQEDSAEPAAPAAGPEPVEATLDAGGEGQRVVARVGQNVTIVVRSEEELDSVSLAEVGIETTEPDSPARFELLAEVPGTYAIELLEAERQIGELEIRD